MSNPSNPQPLLREKRLTMPEVQNPFVHTLHFTWLDKLQIAMMTVTIFPIRIALIFICLVCGWALASIALMGRTKEERREPLKGWRKRCALPFTLIGKVLYYFLGFRVTRRGRQATTLEAPILVISPHSTFFDQVLGFHMELSSPVVAKGMVYEVPLMGPLTQYTQPVFVSREDPNSRQNTIQEIKRRAESKGAWPQIVIFPEGTCTNRKSLITFKPGAFYPGVPVQPVCLKYNNRLDTVTWTWEGPDAFKCLWYTLCQFHTYLEIEFLPVYTPSEEEKKDAKLFGRNVRDIMAKAMGVPVSDHTYEDTLIMNYASKLDLPAATGLVDFAKLSRKLGLKFDKRNFKATLSKYVGIAQEKKGIVTLEEFASYMDMPVSEALTELFKMYDRDGSNTIDFREFVIAISLCGMPANNEDTIKLAFRVYDAGNRGSIVETELHGIINRVFDLHVVDIHGLFKRIDEDKDGKINYAEFKSYVKDKPTYSRLFWTYQQIEEAAHQLSLTKLLMNGHSNDIDHKAKAE